MSLRRIAYVLRMFPKLSETFIAWEIAELLRRGIEIRILSLMEPTEPSRHEIVARAGLDQLVTYDVAEFQAALGKFRPELIHAHYSTAPTEAARDLAGELGVPFTFTAHGRDVYRLPPPDFGERAAAAAAVITVSEANASYIAAKFGVPRRHIRVIPCGVDTSYFHPPQDRLARESDAKPDAPESPPLIVCVARHEPVKNLGLLLEACAALRDRGVKFRCVLVGDGPCRDELESTRWRLRLETRVEMPGAALQAAVLAWWQRGHVAALSSDSEAMPVSLMEAAACGVPAVATRVGGIPELIDHEVTGLLTPPGNASALADSLERLLVNRRLARQMGNAARRRAEEKFPVSLQADRLIAMWNAL